MRSSRRGRPGHLKPQEPLKTGTTEWSEDRRWALGVSPASLGEDASPFSILLQGPGELRVLGDDK